MCLKYRGVARSVCCGRIDVVTFTKPRGYCIFVVGVREALARSSLGPPVLRGVFVISVFEAFVM